IGGSSPCGCLPSVRPASSFTTRVTTGYSAWPFHDPARLVALTWLEPTLTVELNTAKSWKAGYATPCTADSYEPQPSTWLVSGRRLATSYIPNDGRRSVASCQEPGRTVLSGAHRCGPVVQLHVEQRGLSRHDA